MGDTPRWAWWPAGATPTKHMKPLIELTKQIESFDGPWGVWECEYSLDGGNTWHEGCIQSDGHGHATETLEDKNGNPVL